MTDGIIPRWQLGGAWLEMADMLKRAADKLLEDYLVAYKHLNEQTTHAINSGTRETIVAVLDPDLDLYCSYMLLMGYALENLIKGTIICGTRMVDPTFRGATNFADFRAVNKEDGTDWRIDLHGFLNLLKATTIRDDLFTDDEMGVLQYLDKIIIWGGRYPVPKKEDPTHRFGFVCAEPPYIGSRTVLPIPTVNSIYVKTLAEIHRLCAQYRESDEKAS